MNQSIATVDTDYGKATVHVGRYLRGGAIYVQLYTHVEQPTELRFPEPLAMLSTNVVPSGLELADDEFAVRNWSENEALSKAMLASGLFEDTGRVFPTGFVESPVWRLNVWRLKNREHVPPALTPVAA